MNRCALRRFDKHASADRPTDPSFTREQQRLSERIKEREAQDNGSVQYVSVNMIHNTPQNEVAQNVNSYYTPWKTPSTN